MKDRVLKYLRDVEGPKRKRSFGHLIDHFTLGADGQPKIDGFIVLIALAELSREGFLRTESKGVVGGDRYESSFNRSSWMVYQLKRCHEIDPNFFYGANPVFPSLPRLPKPEDKWSAEEWEQPGLYSDCAKIED